MHAELMLWASLITSSLGIAALVIILVHTLLVSRRLLVVMNMALAHMPSLLTERLENMANKALREQSTAQWLLAQCLILIALILIAFLPLNSLLKVFVFLMFFGIWIRHNQKRQVHLKRVIREWPSALDMISMLMHSGLSFRAAIHAFQSVPNDSAALAELGRVQRAQQSGFTLTQSLDSLAKRMSHPWVMLFVGAVVQAHTTGGSLAQTLQQQATQCRQQQLLEAEKRAQEVSVRLMFPLIFCFFPVTMLLILGPVFIGFIQGGIS